MAMWGILNKANKAVCWVDGFDEASARRNAKKKLGLGKLPKDYRAVPVDMNALAAAETARLEKLTQDALAQQAEVPLVDPLTGQEIKE